MNAKQRWEVYRMPETLSNETFLDIGCWSGDMCGEAIRRGAVFAVGIDIVKSPFLIKHSQFHFFQLDVMSPKFLELRDFDYVLCAGVLYHIESPIDLLIRLKNKTRKKIFLETEVLKSPGSFAEYCGGNHYDNNFSNWWVPTDQCVREMMEDCGFSYPMKVYESGDGKRACYHAEPENRTSSKILPRKFDKMDK